MIPQPYIPFLVFVGRMRGVVLHCNKIKTSSTTGKSNSTSHASCPKVMEALLDIVGTLIIHESIIVAGNKQN